MHVSAAEYEVPTPSVQNSGMWGAHPTFVRSYVSKGAVPCQGLAL